MRRKRRVFRTPEERAAWEAEGEAIQRALREHIERIRAERAEGKRKPA